MRRQKCLNRVVFIWVSKVIDFCTYHGTGLAKKTLAPIFHSIRSKTAGDKPDCFAHVFPPILQLQSPCQDHKVLIGSTSLCTSMYCLCHLWFWLEWLVWFWFYNSHLKTTRRGDKPLVEYMQISQILYIRNESWILELFLCLFVIAGLADKAN